MMRPAFQYLLVFAACWAASRLPAAAAAEKTAAQLLPPSTVLYAEAPKPGEVLDLVLDHPLRARVEEFEQYRDAINAPQYRVAKAIVSALEMNIGMSLREAVATITSGGAYVGFDPATEGLALLAKSSDEQVLAKTRDALIELARLDARGKGKQDPLKTVEYRGITAYDAGKAKFAAVGPWLVVVNNDELGKRVLDNLLDDNQPSLADKESFQQARQSIEPPSSAWAFVDVEALRAAGVPDGLYRNTTENPLAELLVGGLLCTANHAPYVTATLRVDSSRLALSLAAPHDPAWVSPAREHYFSRPQQGASAIAPPADALLAVETYRNLSQMWLNSADLFDENVDAELAKADSNLSTFFSGKDFGQDILGAMGPEIQLFLVKQQFGQDAPTPAIKLPAGALVLRLENPEQARGEFRRVFQSLIGFLNVIGAMNGQPQLDQDIEKLGGHQVISAAFLPEADEDKQQAKIQFNFSPSIAFVNDRFVISSTRRLAHELVESIGSERAAQNSSAAVNTEAQLNLAVLRDILDENRSHLVAQNMLQEGHTKEEAETEVGVLLDLLALVRSAGIRLSVDKTIQLDVDVNLADSK